MDAVALTVPAGNRFDSVVSLVLSGLGARLNLPVDRIEDLGLAVSSAQSALAGPVMKLEVAMLGDRVRVTVGPLAEGAASDPSRRRLVDALVDVANPSTRDGQEWLELELLTGAGE